MAEKMYICIDLKSFYASVECVERGLDPMVTKLVVADKERTEKTICLAVSPAMKAVGVKNRCRLFEIPKSLDYIIAPPRMKLYIDYSANIYEVYLKYISSEDIHVYSIDEVFMDVTNYMMLYEKSAKEIGIMIMEDVLKTYGITATCGIGTNMYLAKVALDITAKHSKDNIGELDEERYRELLWDYKPLRDFWRIGRGISAKLERYGIFTMRQITEMDESILYKIFGIDAELLIDHAWGRENTSMADIKSYTPKHNSISSGQVLASDTDYDTGLLIVKEMADLLCLDMVEKEVVTDSISLYLGYSYVSDIENDRGSIAISNPTNSAKIILANIEMLYHRIRKAYAPLRRVNMSFNNIIKENYMQYDLFIDVKELEREKSIQKAMINIKKRYGKNSILKGMNLQEGAKTIERNKQIGGHRSGE